MRNFIGRKDYLTTLNQAWSQKQSLMIALYGRRRVGKTELIQQFGHNKNTLYFEALEGETTQEQIRHFLHQLAKQCQEPHLADLPYHDWSFVFDLLLQKVKNFKNVLLVFDELSWMASSRVKLISLIKYYWDTHLKQHPHLVFILCGSVASWMLKNVVRSKALYGRISHHILLTPLKPFEVSDYIGDKRGSKEILDYLLCFGGIPKYLEEFDFNQSFPININRSCFQKTGFFVEESDKIFYNQFKETQIYQQIVKHLLRQPKTLQEISNSTHLKSGGGLKQYLDNLTAAGLVDPISIIKDFRSSKIYRYHVLDEFLRFHRQFIQPHFELIHHNQSRNLFEKITKQQWEIFLGFAFERFCIKHRYLIADILGCGDWLQSCGPMYQKNIFQWDLVYLRSDQTISLCEIKYHKQTVNTWIIKEFEEKLKKSNIPQKLSIEKILICNESPSQELVDSGYFHRIILAQDLISYRE